MNRGQFAGNYGLIIVLFGLLVVISSIMAFTSLDFGTPQEFEEAADNTVTSGDRGAWDLLKLSVITIALALVVSLVLSYPKLPPEDDAK